MLKIDKILVGKSGSLHKKDGCCMKQVNELYRLMASKWSKFYSMHESYYDSTYTNLSDQFEMNRVIISFFYKFNNYRMQETISVII